MNSTGDQNIERFLEEAQARFKALKRNIVVAGETGVGKSSLINLITNNEDAKVNNDSVGCTFKAESFHAQIGHDAFEIWDTPGLDEGTGGTVVSSAAKKELKACLAELKKKGGVHLLLFCTRGSRATRGLKHTYDAIRQVTPQDVPIAVVVTGLERLGSMDDWWKKNRVELAKFHINFGDHACITTLRDRELPEPYRGRYAESQKTVHELILRNCRSGRPTIQEEIHRIRMEASDAVSISQQTIRSMERSKRRPARSQDARSATKPSVRHVIICDSALSGNTTQIAGSITGAWHSCTMIIHDQLYRFERVSFQQLADKRTMTKAMSDALMFYMDAERSVEVQRLMLCRFYGLYGRKMHPLIIVICGLDDDLAAQTWWSDHICATEEDMESINLVCFPKEGPSAEDRARVQDLIEEVCLADSGTTRREKFRLFNGAKNQRTRRYKLENRGTVTRMSRTRSLS